MQNIESGGAFGINTFCRRNEISRALYYKLKKQGKGPRSFKAGRRELITPEAERDWHKEMEQNAA